MRRVSGIDALALFLLLTLFCACASGADTRLPDAAKSQNRQAILELLAQKVDVNSAQADGTTALHWAANQDDLKLTEILLHAGANPKLANRYGVTPLSLACTEGDGAIVDLLLKAGADPNAALPGGETALMTAARAGRAGAVRVLLANGAKIDAEEPRRGQTALMWAAVEGNVEVVETLLKAGADFRQALTSGYTPFLFAVREGRTGVVQALLKAGDDVNQTVVPTPTKGTKRQSAGGGTPKAGTSALILAVANAHYELASKLLDAGADPKFAGPGYTALHVIPSIRKSGGGDNDPAPEGSGSMGSLELIKKLVDKGADINARMTKKINFGLTSLNTNGATPFFLAARTADAELMRYLVSLGADPLIPNADNSTPLMAAAGLGTRSPGEDAGTEPEVVEAIQTALEFRNNINAVDNNGETAMHSAAYKNLPGAVLILTEKGASMTVWNQKNKHGWTPLMIAAGYRFGNYKPSPVTVAAFEKIMGEAFKTAPQIPDTQ